MYKIYKNIHVDFALTQAQVKAITNISFEAMVKATTRVRR